MQHLLQRRQRSQLLPDKDGVLACVGALCLRAACLRPHGAVSDQPYSRRAAFQEASELPHLRFIWIDAQLSRLQLELAIEAFVEAAWDKYQSIDALQRCIQVDRPWRECTAKMHANGNAEVRLCTGCRRAQLRGEGGREASVHDVGRDEAQIRDDVDVTCTVGVSTRQSHGGVDKSL